MSFCADVWTENERIPWRLFWLSGEREKWIALLYVTKASPRSNPRTRYREGYFNSRLTVRMNWINSTINDPGTNCCCFGGLRFMMRAKMDRAASLSWWMRDVHWRNHAVWPLPETAISMGNQKDTSRASLAFDKNRPRRAAKPPQRNRFLSLWINRSIERCIHSKKKKKILSTTTAVRKCGPQYMMTIWSASRKLWKKREWMLRGIPEMRLVGHRSLVRGVLLLLNSWWKNVEPMWMPVIDLAILHSYWRVNINSVSLLFNIWFNTALISIVWVTGDGRHSNMHVGT